MPMIVLCLMGCVVVFGYYHIPWFSRILDPVKDWQERFGWIAAFANRVVLCGFLPGIFILTMREQHAPRPLLVILAQTLLSGFCGIVSGWMFELHAVWFGTGTGCLTVLIKTFMCQFVWTVAFFVPFGAAVYFWIVRDFSLTRVRRDWPRHPISELLVPNLIANWVVWIPLSLVVHLFPTALQTQLTGLANALLSLLLLSIGRRAGRSCSGR